MPEPDMPKPTTTPGSPPSQHPEVPGRTAPSPAIPSSAISNERLAAEIVPVLTSGRTAGCLLFGPPGAGKSGIIRALSIFLQGSPRYLPVPVDPDTWTDTSLPRMLAELNHAVAAVLGAPHTTPPRELAPEQFQSQTIRTLLSCLAPEQALVLLIDEFRSGLALSAPGVRRFYSILKAACAAHPGRLRILCAMGRRIDDARRLFADRSGTFPVVPAPWFTPPETESALARFTPDAAASSAAVQELTGGHPALIHLIGSGQISGNGSAASGGLGDTILKHAEDLFQSIWQGLAAEHRLIMSIVAQSGGELSTDELTARFRENRPPEGAASVQTTLQDLFRWRLLDETAGGSAATIPVFTRWIALRKPPARVQAELTEMAEELFHGAFEGFKSDNLKPAEEMVQRAIRLRPGQPKYLFLKANILLRMKRGSEAITLLRELETAHPTPLVRRTLAAALIWDAEKGDSLPGQIAAYEGALASAPDHPRAEQWEAALHEKRAQLAYAQGDIRGALHHYGAATPPPAGDAEADAPDPPGEISLFERPRRFRLAATLILGTFGFIVIMVTALTAIVLQKYQDITGDLPTIQSLREYRPPVISTVYADDGTPIAEFYTERRTVVPLEGIPPLLVNAFIAAEDARFYDHEGIDIWGIFRALLKNIEAGAVVQGGSTITQQVVKSFLLTPERSYDRKMKEAVLAYRIERHFTKADILYLYLNQIYLGHGAYGVAAAAQSYFGKPLKELDLAECAMLAGLAKAPSKDSPITSRDRALERRHYVLERMVAENHITPAEAERADGAAISVPPRHNLLMEHVPFFSLYIREYVREIVGTQNLQTGGFQIHTTINLALQKSAQEAVLQGLDALEKRHRYPAELAPQGALICLEPGTGRIKAMVGGRDFRETQFNRALQAIRQPGSAFKPIIYAAALENGFTPASILNDSPFVLPDNDKLWKPVNYDHRFYGPIPLRRALAKSRNIPVVRVLQEIGVDAAADTAARLGIRSPLSHGLSLALGASGVSLLELTRAYAVFANMGKRVPAVSITRMVDRFGNQVILPVPEAEQAVAPGVAFLMNSLLQSVVTGGTGYKARALNRPVAGKTGTTNDFRDAWFIGYTPGLAVGTWVGFDIERPLGRGETGAQAALPIWLHFMERALADHPVQPFPDPPEEVVAARVDADSGLLPIPESREVVTEYFLKDTVPDRHTPHQMVIVEPEEFFKADM